VILHERIETTVTKAKAVRPQVERIITLAKRDTLHARRRAAAYLFEPAAVKKLFDSIGPRFAERAGGYTRIVRLGPRQGDGAETAILELLGTRLAKKAADKKSRREKRMRQERAEEELGADAVASSSDDTGEPEKK
jgi:large subunit ribosomal protein L17